MSAMRFRLAPVSKHVRTIVDVVCELWCEHNFFLRHCVCGVGVILTRFWSVHAADSQTDTKGSIRTPLTHFAPLKYMETRHWLGIHTVIYLRPLRVTALKKITIYVGPREWFIVKYLMFSTVSLYMIGIFQNGLDLQNYDSYHSQTNLAYLTYYY